MHQYNYDHQDGDHNIDVSNSLQVRNKVYGYVATQMNTTLTIICCSCVMNKINLVPIIKFMWYPS